MKPIDNGRIVDYIIPTGEPRVIRIYKAGENGNKPIGSVLIIQHYNDDSIFPEYAEVLHIYVEKPFRRQGYAQDLIKQLKEKHNHIITGWDGSEPAGRELFLKMGFRVNKSLKKSNPSTLEWIRGKDAI